MPNLLLRFLLKNANNWHFPLQPNQKLAEVQPCDICSLGGNQEIMNCGEEADLIGLTRK